MAIDRSYPPTSTAQANLIEFHSAVKTGDLEEVKRAANRLSEPLEKYFNPLPLAAHYAGLIGTCSVDNIRVRRRIFEYLVQKFPESTVFSLRELFELTMFACS